MAFRENSPAQDWIQITIFRLRWTPPPHTHKPQKGTKTRRQRKRDSTIALEGEGATESEGASSFASRSESSLLTFIKIWRGQQADTQLCRRPDKKKNKIIIKQRKGSPVAAAARRKRRTYGMRERERESETLLTIKNKGNRRGGLEFLHLSGCQSCYPNY